MNWLLTKITIVFFCLALLGCEYKVEKTVPQKHTETSILLNYFQSEFNLKLSNEIHYYVIVPRFGCYGCMQKILKALSQLIPTSSLNYFTIIVSNRNENVVQSIDPKFNVLNDSEGHLDKLNLKLYDLKIFRIEQQKVTANRSFHPDSTHTLYNFLKERNQVIVNNY